MFVGILSHRKEIYLCVTYFLLHVHPHSQYFKSTYSKRKSQHKIHFNFINHLQFRIVSFKTRLVGCLFFFYYLIFRFFQYLVIYFSIQIFKSDENIKVLWNTFINTSSISSRVTIISRKISLLINLFKWNIWLGIKK